MPSGPAKSNTITDLPALASAGAEAAPCLQKGDGHILQCPALISALNMMHFRAFPSLETTHCAPLVGIIAAPRMRRSEEGLWERAAQRPASPAPTTTTSAAGGAAASTAAALSAEPERADRGKWRAADALSIWGAEAMGKEPPPPRVCVTVGENKTWSEPNKKICKNVENKIFKK